MSSKFRRGLVAAATSLALVTTATPAMAQEATSADTLAATSALSGATTGALSTGTEAGVAGSAYLAGTTAYVVYAVAGLAVSVAFWGTVYNALVSRGTIQGQIIPQLPVL